MQCSSVCGCSDLNTNDKTKYWMKDWPCRNKCFPLTYYKQQAIHDLFFKFQRGLPSEVHGTKFVTVNAVFPTIQITISESVHSVDDVV